MSRRFNRRRLAGEGKDSCETSPSNQLMRSPHDPMRLPRLLAAEGREDESDLVAVVRVFRRRWRTAARFAAIIMAGSPLVAFFAPPPFPPGCRHLIWPPAFRALFFFLYYLAPPHV